MAKTYRPYVPEQDLLLPPSLREWLPEDHLAYFVSDLIDQLDLSAITTVYEDEERGYPPYHPVMLKKVLVYAYCVGVFSSRRVQRLLGGGGRSRPGRGVRGGPPGGRNARGTAAPGRSAETHSPNETGAGRARGGRSGRNPATPRVRETRPQPPI